MSCQTIQGPTYKYLGLNAQIRPYKKTLGIWYYAKRTITGRFKFDVSYEVDGVTNVLPFNNYVSDYAYTIQRTNTVDIYPKSMENIKFTMIDTWGDTPSTSTVSIICN